MRKRSNLSLPTIVALCLTLCLSSFGVTYAGWNEQLQINSDISTSTMNVFFNSDQYKFYRVGLYDTANQQSTELVAGEESISVDLKNKNQMANITIEKALSTEILKELTKPGKMLILQYSLDLDAKTKVELSKADFDKPLPDTVFLNVKGIVLNVDGSDFVAPKVIWDEYDIPLEFEVYPQLEVKQDQLLATMYLRLINGNDLIDLNDLQEFNLDREIDLSDNELLNHIDGLDMTDLGAVTFSAEVKVSYEIELPIYVEQGHYKSWSLDKKDSIDTGNYTDWTLFREERLDV